MVELNHYGSHRRIIMPRNLQFRLRTNSQVCRDGVEPPRSRGCHVYSVGGLPMPNRHLSAQGGIRTLKTLFLKERCLPFASPEHSAVGGIRTHTGIVSPTTFSTSAVYQFQHDRLLSSRIGGRFRPACQEFCRLPRHHLGFGYSD